MTERITIELVETNVFTRWPCTVCGGHTEKVSVLRRRDADRIDGFDRETRKWLRRPRQPNGCS
jgi:hypothetical protein